MSGCLNVNPSFIDVVPAYYSTPTKFNFGIQSTSAASGAGTSLGAPANDFVGATRANPPAIGAYEAKSVTPVGSVPPVTVSSVSCTPASLTSGLSSTCTVALNGTAAANGASVVLSSNVASLTVPTAVSILSGSTTGSFMASVGTIQSSQTAVITAALGGSATTTISLVAASGPVLNSLSCSLTSLTTSGSSVCAIGVSPAAGSGGATVSLASNNSTLVVPATVSIAAGATTASFTATAGSITVGQTAIVTASVGSASLTVSISLVAGILSSSLSQPGWHDLSGTVLQNVCPANNFDGINYAFASYCKNVINAWGGGIADTGRSRLIMWGGGHVDYSGNEVYSLNLGATPATLTRISDPSVFASAGESNADGTPVSRHTYQDLVYLPQANKMFSFGGGLAPSGQTSVATWLLDLSCNAPLAASCWSRMVDGPMASSGGYACMLDPTQSVESVLCVGGNTYLTARYTPSTNTWTKLTSVNGTLIPSTSSCAIDPIRAIMLCVGRNTYGGAATGMYTINLSAGSTYAATNITANTTGCNALTGVDYIGLQYDSVLGAIVGWPNTGNSVYVFNPDTKACTVQTFPGGPQYTILPNGTFGRFQYFPALDAFALVNQANSDAFLLKLNPPASGPVSACDLNGDGVVNAADVQLAVNQTLGVAPCTNASLQQNGQCNVVDVQRVIKSSLGGSCLTGQ